jgi:hypothetical protein
MPMTRPHLALASVLGVQAAFFFALADTPPPRQAPPTGFPPAPDGPAEAGAYFPDAVGAEWSYRVTMDDRRGKRTHTEVRVVASAVSWLGMRLLTVRQLEGDDPSDVRAWAASASRLQDRAVGRYGGGPWHTILQGPVVPGTRWVVEYPGDDEKVVLTVRGWEMVRVPAGTSAAVRVDFVITYTRGKGNTITGTEWMAPGVGLVRMEGSCAAPRLSFVRELVSFKPGGG